MARATGRFYRMRCWTTTASSESSLPSTAWISSTLISSPVPNPFRVVSGSVTPRRQGNSCGGGSWVSDRQGCDAAPDWAVPEYLGRGADGLGDSGHEPGCCCFDDENPAMVTGV